MDYKSGESGVFVGELLFNYPNIDQTGSSVIYSVDVFINNQTGSKITALGPGTSGKKVGLEYGYYLFTTYIGIQIQILRQVEKTLAGSKLIVQAVQ